MDAATTTKADAQVTLTGAKIITAIKQSGVEFILAVPDIVTSKGLLFPIAADKELKLVRVCKEDECVGIASGLTYSDKRALILIQYTGFLNSLNAIRAVAVEYEQPIVMMVGLLGHEPERLPANSGRYGVRIIEPICDAMGITHHLISQDSDVAKIKPAIDKAYTEVVAGRVPGRTEAVMMNRDECFEILKRHITDEVVVASYSGAVEWNDLNPRALNYFSIGAMGLGSSHALGVALGRPDRRVVVLDGDGSLLINLGSLVSIAAAAPKNLVHFVCHNETYEANGGHPLPNPKTDFAGLARSAGYAHVHDFAELKSFEQQVGHVLTQQGPVFATLHVKKNRPLVYKYDDLYKASRRVALKAALQG